MNTLKCKYFVGKSHKVIENLYMSLLNKILIKIGIFYKQLNIILIRIYFVF